MIGKMKSSVLYNRDFKIYDAASSSLQNVKKQYEFKHLKEAAVN